MLESLHQLKSINPYGVEIDQKKILSCLSKNIPVIQADIDESIRDFEGLDFDIAILASSIQCLRHPDKALSNILSIAKKCIVTVPNFAHWQCRLQLSQGKMPVTKDLPAPCMQQIIFIFVQLKTSNALYEIGSSNRPKKYEEQHLRNFFIN